jgi:hypothetical protein
MNPNKKAIFKTYLEPPKGGLAPGEDPDDYPLERITMSSESSVDPVACAFTINTPAHIFMQSPPFTINVEDMIFTANDLNFPLQGNNQYFKVEAGDPVVNTYQVQVNNDGIVTDVLTCI